MGKDKDKKRKRDHSDSDSDRDKKHKKDKDKKKKKDKDSKKDKKDKKSSRDPKDIDPITADDYFAKNPEFRVWLSESKGKVFGDLSEDDCKKYFEKFVEKYNSGELRDKIYKGVTFSELDKGQRTSHKWSFAKKLDTFESDTLKDRIFSDSQNASLLGSKQPARPGAAGPPNQMGQVLSRAEKEEQMEAERAQYKLARKQESKRRKEDLDELAPKADPGSFQARLEKKAQKGSYARERPDSPEMKETDVMGGDSIKAYAMKKQQYREEAKAQKAVEGQQKLAAYQEKEREKMNEFRKMMGLPPE